MYYDPELLELAERHYPQYLPLFKSLKGVYMADMARVLIIYHYGGIYLDLDFYCHRPFSCLEAFLPPLTSATSSAAEDILIVSLEPKIHANIFRDKDRVVIQDFYMATARHPFFKWLLDDRLARFLQDPEHPAKGPFSYSIEKDIDAYWMHVAAKTTAATTAKHSRQLGSQDRIVLVNSTNTSMLRRGVGVKDLGREREAGRSSSNSISNSSSGSSSRSLGSSRGLIAEPSSSRSSSSSPGSNAELRPSSPGSIVELPADVLHPLVDETNSRLYSKCAAGWIPTTVATIGSSDRLSSNSSSSPTMVGKQQAGILDSIWPSTAKQPLVSVPAFALESCELVKRRELFRPSERTVAVHMWTHTYLGWSFLRGLYNDRVYAKVESRLPPTLSCPSVKAIAQGTRY
jgi:hypothetical protein